MRRPVTWIRRVQISPAGLVIDVTFEKPTPIVLKTTCKTITSLKCDVVNGGNVMDKIVLFTTVLTLVVPSMASVTAGGGGEATIW